MTISARAATSVGPSPSEAPCSRLCPCRVKGTPYVPGIAACGDAEKDVTFPAMGKYLPAEDIGIRIVVGDRRKDRGIGREGHGREGRPVFIKTAHELPCHMLGVGGAAPVTADEELVPIRIASAIRSATAITVESMCRSLTILSREPLTCPILSEKSLMFIIGIAYLLPRRNGISSSRCFRTRHLLRPAFLQPLNRVGSLDIAWLLLKYPLKEKERIFGLSALLA